MDRVEQIEDAISNLPADDYLRIVNWFRAHEETRWDQQMDHDSSTGKLNFLFDEAESDSTAGVVSDWPSPK